MEVTAVTEAAARSRAVAHPDPFAGRVASGPFAFTACSERCRTSTRYRPAATLRYERHVGLRFSRKASIPSPASSSIMLRAITSPAYA